MRKTGHLERVSDKQERDWDFYFRDGAPRAEGDYELDWQTGRRRLPWVP